MKSLHIKLWSVMSVVSGCVLMTGCLSNTPNVPDDGVKQICNAPKYNIVLGKIEHGKDNTLLEQEFMAVLDKALADSNCFVVQKEKDDDTTYTLDIKYNFTMNKTIEETGVISTKDNANITSDVQFNLYNETKTIQQNATSTLKLSEKKYLGIGEYTHITQEQKENLLRRSLKTIFTNLSTMP